MTVEEYYGVVRRLLGLKQTDVPHIYHNVFGEVFRVPDAEKQTLEQRTETIEMLKQNLGISD